ncbi:MAG: HNH endonuclease, partial [Bacteroidales bacterium]|nr:HNH endonuclease [Bacteroidales bacterium]
RYYFITGQTPVYYPFSERDNYDISVIARYIIDNDLGQNAEDRYINEKWEDSKGGWQTFFDMTIKNFRNEIARAKDRIRHPEDYIVIHKKPQEIFEDRSYEDMSMFQIREVNPAYEKWLRNKVFEKFTDENGNYFSAQSGYKSRNRFDFEIDHIKPLSAGGKTVLENLQLLKVFENRQKGGKWENDNKKVIDTALKAVIRNLEDCYYTFIDDAETFIKSGKNVVGVRARKASKRLEVLTKRFRKESRINPLRSAEYYEGDFVMFVDHDSYGVGVGYKLTGFVVSGTIALGDKINLSNGTGAVVLDIRNENVEISRVRAIEVDNISLVLGNISKDGYKYARKITLRTQFSEDYIPAFAV